MSDERLTKLALYVVKNKEGKFFRRKGYGGGGSSWVDDVATARFYVKIAGARAIVGFYAGNYPQFGIPDIVKLTVSEVEVLDESERVKKQQEKKKKAVETAEVRQKQYELNRAQAEYDRAKAALELKKGK